MSAFSTPFGPANAREFYAENNVVFITGGTGFVGKTLLEKILRSIPQVKKIYLLMRVSPKVSLQDRLEKELISSRIFETLKNHFTTLSEFRKEVISKLIPVAGDLVMENLGLSIHDLAMIQKDTRVVFHCAASIKFDDTLKNAMEFNIKGPLRMLKLAQGMPRLASFVHVSTAFVNSFRLGTIYEQIYPHPLGDAETIYDLLTKMSCTQLDKFEKLSVLTTFPNTYTFTKSMTEHLIQARYQQLGLPIVIVRPSVIIGAISEPVPGWVEGLSALNKATHAVALGEIQEWIGSPMSKIDLAPVDLVIKVMLLAATTADCQSRVPSCSMGSVSDSLSSTTTSITATTAAAAAAAATATATIPGPLIYHSCTTGFDPVTWQQFCSVATSFWQTVQPVPARRISNDIRFEFYCEAEFKQRFEARFGELLNLITKKGNNNNNNNNNNSNSNDNKGGFTVPNKRLFRRIMHAYEVPVLFKHFALYDWVFSTDKIVEMDSLAPAEFTVQGMSSGSGVGDGGQGIGWHQYLVDYNFGVQEFLLNEKPDRAVVVQVQQKPVWSKVKSVASFNTPPMEAARI